ncbi:hypothetical protein KAX35_05870 [candidate division WOR-3 bacterium]|nr:hypothetical protein [candidate division WOR-3 bacterium]
MKIFVFIIGFLVCQFLGITNAQSENMTKDLFPGSKLIWEKEFSDKIVDIQQGGQNIVVVERKDNVQHTVYYLDVNGNIVWEKTFEIERDIYGTYRNRIENISISDDGKHIIANCKLPWERVVSKSYDSKGNLMWESDVKDHIMEPGLTVSPKGSYAITTRESGEEGAGIFRVFDNQTGEEIWTDKTKKRGSWIATFLNDTEIVYASNISISQKPTICVLRSFDTRTQSIMWEINLREDVKDPSIAGMISGFRKVETSKEGKLIAITVFVNYDDRPYCWGPRAVLMFDNKSNLLWGRDDFVTLVTPTEEFGGVEKVSFSLNSEELYVMSSHTIDILDALTGERKQRLSQETFDFSMNEYVFINGYLIVTPQIRYVLSKTIDPYERNYPQVFDSKTGNQLNISENCKDIALMIPVDNEGKYTAILTRNLKTLQYIKIE